MTKKKKKPTPHKPTPPNHLQCSQFRTSSDQASLSLLLCVTK